MRTGVRPGMKKVLIANKLECILREQKIFLDRADIKVSTTAVNDEILRIHREEKVNLIATTLDTFPEAGLKISLTL